MKARSQNPEWLTVPQVAAHMQCGDDLIYRAIATGKLRAVRLGRRLQLRVHVEWLAAWLDTQATVVDPSAPGRSIPYRHH